MALLLNSYFKILLLSYEQLLPDVGAAENAAAAAWGRISFGGGGVSAAGTHFFGNIIIVPLTDIL